jgi:hypothetical protein
LSGASVLNVFAAFPFPGTIDPNANTVQPGQIYATGNMMYFAEKQGDTIQLFEVRASDEVLTKANRQTAIYNATTGNIITATDSNNATVPPANYAPIPATGGGIGYTDTSITATPVPAAVT